MLQSIFKSINCLYGSVRGELQSRAGEICILVEVSPVNKYQSYWGCGAKVRSKILECACRNKTGILSTIT